MVLCFSFFYSNSFLEFGFLVFVVCLNVARGFVVDGALVASDFLFSKQNTLRLFSYCSDAGGALVGCFSFLDWSVFLSLQIDFVFACNVVIRFRLGFLKCLCSVRAWCF